MFGQSGQFVLSTPGFYWPKAFHRVNTDSTFITEQIYMYRPIFIFSNWRIQKAGFQAAYMWHLLFQGFTIQAVHVSEISGLNIGCYDSVVVIVLVFEEFIKMSMVLHGNMQ